MSDLEIVEEVLAAHWADSYLHSPQDGRKEQAAIDALGRIEERLADLEKQLPVDLRERLADLAHKQWSGWMGYLFGKGESNEDGTWTMPAWAVKRWRLQAATPFSELSGEEKDSDRKEADKFLAVMEGATDAR